MAATKTTPPNRATRSPPPASPRPSTHKPLIDALIDSESKTAEVARKAGENADGLKDQLKTGMRNILDAAAKGKLTPEAAKALWRRLWVALSLAAFTRVAADVAAAEAEYLAVLKEAEALGPEKLKVSPIRDADKVAREQEKRNGDSQAEGTGAPPES